MVAMVGDMVMYETVRLRGYGKPKTVVFYFSTGQKLLENEPIHVVLDNFNKNGYFLTAVCKNVDSVEYYLTKRID